MSTLSMLAVPAVIFAAGAGVSTTAALAASTLDAPDSTSHSPGRLDRREAMQAIMLATTVGTVGSWTAMMLIPPYIDDARLGAQVLRSCGGAMLGLAAGFFATAILSSALDR